MTSKRESCHPERSRGILSIASIQSSIPLLTEPRERLLMALLAYTSMKREELLGLRWENVDMENRLIHICEAVSYKMQKQSSRV